MATNRKKKKNTTGVVLICVIAVLTAVLVGLLVWGMMSENAKPDPTVTTAPPQTTESFPEHVVPFDPSVPEEPSEDPEQDTTASTEPLQTTKMRLVANVSVMTEPDEHSMSSGTLLAGNEIDVVEFQKDWIQVLIGKDIRYIPAGTVREIGKFLVVIDAGHQARANTDKEPVGPGATEEKTKVASGTQGVSTGIPEYQLTLAVSLKLQKVLEERGYQVAMIRSTHDVDISNAERAQVANGLHADAFIRVHANGAEDSTVKGIVTVCQTKDNPYNGTLYEQCRALSDAVLEEMASATGSKGLYVWETDTMSGINWCTVPVTIVEMGFMSNPEEDELMATEGYQEKLAIGIANGIDNYFD